MKSKEEMIEVMARAMRENVKFGDFWDKNDSEVLAEAALKALCGALPELTKKPKFSGFIDSLVMTDAPKLYNQLKQWGE